MNTRELLRVDKRDDGIAVITLDNPPLNVNTLATISTMRDALERIANDDAIRVVIITGAGERAFCAGSDIHEFTDVLDAVVDKKLRAENTAFTQLERLPQPVIAAINGVTLGGGVEITLACDIRIADEHARFGLPEINLGVFPGSGGVFRLVRLIGQSAAYKLLYTGDIITAADAQRIGLIDDITPTGQALDTALELAKRIAAKPSLALSIIRSEVRAAFDDTTDQAIARTLADSDRVFTGPDIHEGVQAFFAKRPPQFTAGRHHKPSTK
jgi:enoyl-CoA hydratase